MSNLRPGKGFTATLNEGVLAFLEEAASDIKLVYTDEMHDNDPEEVITSLAASKDTTLEWVEGGSDDYAKKRATASMPYRTGELRVNLLFTKRNEIAIDVRYWFDPSNARS